MSLKDLQLPSFVINSLYKDALVIPDKHSGKADTPNAPIKKEPEAYVFLGQHLKKTSIIVNDAKHAFLPEAQLTFLIKILEACKMNLADVAILNQAKKTLEIEKLKKQLQPGMVILFGLETTSIKLPFAIPPFKIQEYDQCRYLCAAPLEQLIQNNADGKAVKTKLWACLKEMFGV